MGGCLGRGFPFVLFVCLFLPWCVSRTTGGVGFSVVVLVRVGVCVGACIAWVLVLGLWFRGYCFGIDVVGFGVWVGKVRVGLFPVVGVVAVSAQCSLLLVAIGVTVVSVCLLLAVGGSRRSQWSSGVLDGR